MLHSVSTKPARLPVVSPDGRIRYEPCLTYVTSSVIARVERVDGDRVVTEWRVKPAAEVAGWSTLQSLYQAEGRDEDWRTFCEWLEHAEAGTADALPDEYLPDEIIRRRNQVRRPERFKPPARSMPKTPRPRSKRTSTEA